MAGRRVSSTCSTSSRTRLPVCSDGCPENKVLQASPSRLNRELGRRHGIDAYAFEELVAEMGAAFLCAHCGLPARLEHATYIEHWLDALKRDKRLIFVAAGKAQAAADYVIGTQAVVPSPVAALAA